LDYAMMLEAETPAATLTKLESVRPAAMGATRKEREEAAKTHQPAAPAHATAAADDKRK
jgi:hypothetical protein